MGVRDSLFEEELLNLPLPPGNCTRHNAHAQSHISTRVIHAVSKLILVLSRKKNQPSGRSQNVVCEHSSFLKSYFQCGLKNVVWGTCLKVKMSCGTRLGQKCVALNFNGNLADPV